MTTTKRHIKGVMYILVFKNFDCFKLIEIHNIQLTMIKLVMKISFQKVVAFFETLQKIRNCTSQSEECVLRFKFWVIKPHACDFFHRTWESTE